jgi:hypothetical protein
VIIKYPVLRFRLYDRGKRRIYLRPTGGSLQVRRPGCNGSAKNPGIFSSRSGGRRGNCSERTTQAKYGIFVVILLLIENVIFPCQHGRSHSDLLYRAGDFRMVYVRLSRDSMTYLIGRDSVARRCACNTYAYCVHIIAAFVSICQVL